MEPVLLARLQFAFTISFHIIFPTLTIGLSAYMATLALMAQATWVGRVSRRRDLLRIGRNEVRTVARKAKSTYIVNLKASTNSRAQCCFQPDRDYGLGISPITLVEEPDVVNHTLPAGSSASP